MNLQNSLNLYAIYLKSLINKVWFDLIREIVVAICSSVLILLFIYIFQDFINVKLAVIDEATQVGFARSFSVIILVIVSSYLARCFQRWKSQKESLEKMAQRLGENPATISTFLIMKTIGFQVLFLGLTWIVLNNYIYKGSTKEQLGAISLAAILSLIGYLLPSQGQKETSYSSVVLKGNSIFAQLAIWRLNQMFFRNRLTRLCVVLSFVFLAGTILIAVSEKGLPLAVLCSLISGYLLSGSLIFQLQDDMEHSWLEKHCGVSHDQFTKTYLFLGLLLGATCGLLNGIAYYLCSPSGESITEVAKLVPIAGLPSLMLAALMFQVDPKRPGIQFITNFIVSLFLGTAIFAHWLSLLLVPVALYYSIQYQKGSFYQN